MRRAVGPGSELNVCARLRVIGNTIAPPRAVSDGTNGASTTSDAASEYASVSALCPNLRMNRYAIRTPKPVAVTAREKRNAVKTSHTVGLAKPERTRAG